MPGQQIPRLSVRRSGRAEEVLTLKPTPSATTQPAVVPASPPGLTPLERSELRERLLTRKPGAGGKDEVDMTVFERLPDALLRQQAEIGVQAAQKELARRKAQSPA